MKQVVYTRSEFVDRIRELVNDLEQDHEEQTGITCGEQGTFEFWVGEICNAELNA